MEEYRLVTHGGNGQTQAKQPTARRNGLAVAPTPTWNASGGNPNGWEFVDNNEGPVAFAVAPAAYLSNLLSYDRRGPDRDLATEALRLAGAASKGPERGHINT